MVRTLKSIPDDRKRLLSLGLVSSNHLMEQIAVDPQLLWQTTFSPSALKQLGLTGAFNAPDDLHTLNAKIVAAMQAAGSLIQQSCMHLTPEQTQKMSAFLMQHPSDTVRGWCCYYIAHNGIDLKQAIYAMTPLINDPHFGVREWAWLALRPKLLALDAASLNALINEVLLPYARSESENLKRFSVEYLRSRGVWCKYFPLMQAQPNLALPILQQVFMDDALYVRKSVGNWLNDLAKLASNQLVQAPFLETSTSATRMTGAQWVQSVCQIWQIQAEKTQASAKSLANLAFITQRALRSINQ